MSDSVPQHMPYGTNKTSRLFIIQGAAVSRGMNSGMEQSFTGIDVPNSSNPALIEEEGFDCLSAALQQRPEPYVMKSATHWIPSQRPYLRHQAELRYFMSGKQSEAAGIPIFQLC